MAFELGLYTFGDLMPIVAGRARRSARSNGFAEILAAARLADASGLDVFAVGEHHRLDMAVSATPVVLAAIAAVTERVRLASAVTILSTSDPVLVFEDFATVDLISGRRAELIAGRGIFTESFPLFGYDLADYDDLFAEKLELLMQLNAAERVTWQGRFRPPLKMRPFRRGRRKTACRSGSAPAACRAASCAPARSACRWRSPISACRRQARAARRSLPAHRTASRARRGHAQDQHRHPHAHQGKFARRPEQLLSVLCRLLFHPHALAISRADTRPIMTNAAPRMARFSPAARSRSSTRFCMSASCSATSVSCRRSTSAACRMPQSPA